MVEIKALLACLAIDFFCLDSGSQSWSSDRAKTSVSVSVSLESGDSYVKTRRPSRHKLPAGTANGNEMPV